MQGKRISPLIMCILVARVMVHPVMLSSRTRGCDRRTSCRPALVLTES